MSMSEETIFAKIIRREVPATIVYEDEEVLGFKDIMPRAPVHVLFIPKPQIIPTLDDLHPEQGPLIGKLVLAAAEYARREGFAQDGYRIAHELSGAWWADSLSPPPSLTCWRAIGNVVVMLETCAALVVSGAYLALEWVAPFTTTSEDSSSPMAPVVPKGHTDRWGQPQHDV